MLWLDRFTELIEDWSYVAQREDWSSAMLAILKKMTGLLYHRRQFVVMARSLLEPLPDLHPRIDLEIRPFEKTDLALIQGFTFPSDVNLCARRLECGHRGVIALAQRQFAGYAWSYTMTQPVLDHIRVDLSPKEVLFLSDYTVPTFRGRGIQTALILTRLRMFLDLGYQRSYSCIRLENSPSLAAYRKAGGHEFGVIDELRLGPWRRLRCRLKDELDG